jgi:asparagine synthase (glutamine-hydrolysing)
MRKRLAFDPSPAGLHVEKHVAFGHCPWPVTRDDAFDRQPAASRSGRYLMTADVRIYNRKELIGDLGLHGVPADKIPDSAILLAAWERWQINALQRIEGDYAFGLWDRKTRTFYSARDPFGHRPLVWCLGKDFFAFASLPKALFTLPGITSEVNRERMVDLLAALPLVGADTLFRGIQRVIPGHCLQYNERGLSQIQCRCLDPGRRIVLKSDDAYLEAFREHLERAVGERLRTRNGVACQLSSGYDSSTVTATAARLLARDGRRLTALTAVPRAGFDGPVPKGRKGNEGPAARALAERFPNIDHRLVSVGPKSPLEGLHETNIDLDAPFHNPDNRFWWQQIQREAAGCGANVLLTGQMGNLTISHPGKTLLSRSVRSGHWLRWWRECTALRRSGQSLKSLLASSFAPFLPPRLWPLIQKIAGREVPDLYRISALRADFARAMKLPKRARTAGWDLAYAPKSDSRKLRIAAFKRSDFGNMTAWSARNGVEYRDPTADFRLASFCIAIPENQYLRNGQTRWLLKRLMSNALPPEILHQQGGKGLQAADWYEGLLPARAEVRRWIERLANIPAARDILDFGRMAAALDNWPADGLDQAGTIWTYRFMLLRGLSVGSFIRYVEENGRPKVQG